VDRTKLLQESPFFDSGRPFCGLEVTMADLFWLSDEQWMALASF
jgi:hypothetical protein